MDGREYDTQRYYAGLKIAIIYLVKWTHSQAVPADVIFLKLLRLMFSLLPFLTAQKLHTLLRHFSTSTRTQKQR